MSLSINKIKRVLAVVFSAAGSFAFAQSYNFTPAKTFIANASFSLPTHFNIQQNNLTNGNLVFSWEQIFINIPQGWTANLCDNGHCYTGFPSNGTMDTVFNGDYGLMSVGINPDINAGTAIIKYLVWEQNSPNQKDTLTWIITASGFTGINNIALENKFSIYPNPAKESINIISNQNTDFQFLITDFNGNKIQEDYSKSNTVSVSTRNISDGIYFISIFNKNKIITTQQIIIHY